MKRLMGIICVSMLAAVTVHAQPAEIPGAAMNEEGPPDPAAVLAQIGPVAFGVACGGCPEDINADGIVDFGDVLLLIAAWGPCPGCPEDVNGDGFVDFIDLLLVLAAHDA